MEVLLFKGTPEEFSKVAPFFSTSDGQPTNSATIKKGSEEQSPKGGVVNEEIILRVLKRKKIKNGQTRLYQAFSKFGDEWVSASQLAATMGKEKTQLAGVLGALGRRINETEGVSRTNPPGIELFFDFTHEDGGEWSYRLRPEVRAILKQEGII
jgi:hypothetical protein